MATLRRVAPLEIGCVAAWLMIIAVDVTLIAAGRSFSAHPVHGIAVSLIAVASWYALTQRALRPVHVALTELRVRQAGALVEITGEIPRAGDATTARLRELVEASDRDRDLLVASLHDEIERVKADAQHELRASMRWVFERLAERGIDP